MKKNSHLFIFSLPYEKEKKKIKVLGFAGGNTQL
jgi:hypothetical protein